MRNRFLLMLMTASVAVTAATARPPVMADVFKYVDSAGNVVFSDKRLENAGLRLEWKRAGEALVAENREQSERVRERRREAAARLRESLALKRHQWLGRSPLWGSPAGALTSPKRDASLQDRRAHYRALIDNTAREYQLWPELLHAVVRTESAYRADAQSSAGACGLMQLMPGTAERFKVRNIWDPAENLRGGAAYLRFLLNLFQSDLRLALAAYNAGENAVKRYGNTIPPYPETQDYVRKVLRFLHAERQAFRS
ncbi:Soluble lytic murein transglycosylase precursor [Thiorhodovibrio winogradskyi]|uniref:Soluble lytic murein transglycosylase n=2 Tax=Thiorhodovibrio winogradskyi TaxID=77007 RepID=A0ABZ0SCJ3_9GAMM